MGSVIMGGGVQAHWEEEKKSVWCCSSRCRWRRSVWLDFGGFLCKFTGKERRVTVVLQQQKEWLFARNDERSSRIWRSE